MSLNSRTEEYYKKFIELQEKLRKSEEERLKLEIKFNEMLQITREEEQMHYRKLRSQYKRFLEEDRRRQDRNERILRTLERIENRVAMLVAKTERFKLLRQQYQTFLDRIYKVNQLKKVPQPREEITAKVQPPNNTEEKSDLVQSYIQNLSSQKLRDMLTKEEISRTRLPFTPEQKPKQEYFLSDESEFRPNYASYIADDIMNSIHSRHKIDDSTNNTPLREQNNNLHPQMNEFERVRKSYDNKMDFGAPRDIYQGSFLTKPPEDTYSDDLSETSVESVKKSFETNRPNMRVSKEKDKEHEDVERLNASYKATELPPKQLENFNYDTARTEIQPPAISDDVKMYKPINETLAVETRKETVLQKLGSTDEQEIQKQANDQTENVQLPQLDNNKMSKEVNESKKQPQYENEPSKLQEQEVTRPSFSDKPKTELPKFESPKDNEDIELRKDDHVVDRPRSIQEAENKQPAYDYENQHHYQPREHEATPQYEKERLMQNNETGADGVTFEQPQYNETELDQQSNESGQPVQMQEYDTQFVQQYNDHGQFIQPYDETGQPIQQYDETGQFLQQYDQSGQPIDQYDENLQPIQQYDKSGQPIQQQYDQNAQPIQQYDENGQPIQQQYDQNVQPIQQYDENGQPIQQQYNQNVQPIQQYEDGQPIQQYDENRQPMQQQYDQNVQPIYRYDENGQPIQQQYDQSGQPVQQYDENGQPIQQYDENEQPVHQQYDQNVQPIQQYDENGQLIQQQYDQSGQQYDENGQLIQQYDENGQPIQQHYELYQQYDEQGQLQQYDSSGQLISQYDENGQLLQPYSELQYDENGQIIQYDTSGQDPAQLQYSEGGDVQQYDEHGNPIQFETDQQSHQQSYEEKQPEIESTSVEYVPQENLRNTNDIAARTSNVMEMLDTDTDSLKQTTKVSNDSDFDFSNG